MGKLGNKFKSTIFVLIAVLAAVAAFPFAANLFGVKQLTNDEISNLKAADPGNDFDPDNYVTNKPTLHTTVVYNGYSTNPIKSGPTYKTGFSASVRYKLVHASGNVKITSTGSAGGPDCDMYFFPGSTSTTVYYQLIYSGTTPQGSAYTRNSVWSKVGVVSVTRGSSITVTVWDVNHPSTNYTYSAENNNKYPFSSVSPYNCYVNSTSSAYVGNSLRARIKYFATNSSAAPGTPSKVYDTPREVEAVCGGVNYLWAKVEGNSYVNADSVYQYLDVSRPVVNFPNAFVSSSYSVLSGRSATVPYTGSKYKYPFEVNATFKFNTANVIYVAVAAESIGYDMGGYTSAELKNLEFSAVGTYNTFARVKGDGYTNDSGYIKIDGASFTITKANLTAGYITETPTASSGTFDTGAALFSGSVTVSDGLVGGGTVSYGFSTAAGATGPTITGYELSEITTKLGVGTFTLWYKITGDSNWNDTDWFKGAEATVSKADGKLEVGNLIAASTQYYDGGDKTMFYNEVTVTGNGGTVYYYIVGPGDKDPDANTAGTESIPTEKYPGKYTLWFRRAGNNFFNAVGWKSTGLSATINNGQTNISTYTLAANSATVSYKNGLSLFTGSGNVSEGKGTIYYCVTTGDKAANKPTVTGHKTFADMMADFTILTSANTTWYLWYRLDADDYYTDIGWEYTGFSKYYAKATGATVKSKDLAAVSDTVTYNGSPKQVFKGEATWNTGAGSKIVYAYSNSNSGTAPSDTTEYDSAAAAKPTDAGTWYLWCKSKSNNYWEDSAWWCSGKSKLINEAAQTTTTTTAFATSVTKQTFNGSSFKPFTGAISVTSGNKNSNAITYAVFNSSGTMICSDTSTTNLWVKTVGTYTLKYSIAACKNYKATDWTTAKNSSNSNVTVTIEKQTSAVLSGSGIITRAQKLGKNLTWNGESQLVIDSTSGYATNTNGDLSASTFYYYLRDHSVWASGKTISEGSAVHSLTAEDAGTYYLFACSSASDTGTDNTSAATVQYLSVSVTIDKLTPELKKGDLAVLTTDAVYFDAQKAQTLFKGAGSTTSDEKIQYALGSSSAATGDWTTDIAAVQLAKGQAIGTYYLWYKVPAGDNCKEVTAQRVKLSDGTYLSKTISKLASPTFTANSSLKALSLTYNKKSQKLFEAEGVSDAAANSTGDGDTIYYYVTGTSATPTVAVTNANVKTDVGDLVSTNVGTGDFYLWYQQNGTTNCAATTGWVYSNLCTKMARATVNITKEGTGTITAHPNLMPFTNSAQILFTGSKIALDSNNVAVTDGHIEYYVTDENAAPASTVTGVEDVETLTRTNHDTYYCWYRFNYSANYVNDESWSGPVAATIEMSTPKLDNKGSSVLKAETNLFYTGEGQTLFTGAGHIEGTSVGQSIEYGYSTSLSAPAPISSTVTTDLSALQAQDGWTSATEQIKYFLWYRLTESQNCEGTDWAKVKDANNADVYATIGKATLSIALNLTPARDYNAQNFSVFAKAPTLTSTAPTAHYTVTYKVTKTYVDGARVLVNEYVDSAYANASGIVAACEIKVQAKWSLKSTVTGTAVYQYATQSSFKDLDNNTTAIRQISAASVTASGFTHSNLKLSADSSSVSCTPYSDVAVDLTVLGYAQNNGITTNNTLMTDDGTEPLNKLSYILTTASTAPSSGYKLCTTAAALNAEIKEKIVNKATKWYLWFRVERHINLTTGSTFLGDSFTVAGFDDVTLDGLTMTGATSDIKAGTVTYSGSPYILATGTIKPVEAVTLGTTYYGLSNDVSTKPASSSWTTDLSTLEVTAARDTPYYLWVKWDASETVAASNGEIYGTLQVNKYTAAAEDLEFTGLSFSSWGTPDASHVFSKPFKNGAYTLATESATPTVTVTNNDQIASSEFGTLSFAVGTETEASTSYYGIDAIGQLGIKDCGTTYYIWVKWTGGDNVKAGAAHYRYTYESNVVVPKFKITQVTSLGTNEVTLKSADIATAKSSNGSVFKYDFLTSARTYIAKSQALFDATTTTPSINFNGSAYSANNGTISYQYLISDKDSGITESTSGWVDKIADAEATAVKSAYYLWVKVTINDKNVNLATAINTWKTAKIVAAESIVNEDLKPQKITDKLVANGSPIDLIIPSAQIWPAVEYSLDGITFSAYGDAVRPTTASTDKPYKIYYRGAATSDGSFVAQGEDSTGYPYYEVWIYPQDATAIIPQSNDVIYNGEPRTASELITKGFAVIGEENRELEYAWNTDANYVSFDNLASQKDAGEYTLWYRYVAANENESAVSPSSITVKIQRAAITMQTCTWTKVHEYNYNAADHTFLEAALDYTINGTSIKYSTGAESQTMGKIYYALTSSNTEAPAIEEDCWTPNFADLKARKVGSYYIWVRVDDSGKNHKDIDPVCYNKNYAIKINLAAEQKYDQSTVTVIENLRFNAESQALISNFTLGVSVPNSAETSQYKVVPNEDYAYTAYYYLSDNASVYPSIEGDLIANGWSTDYKTLKQTNADTYYLIVFVKVEDGSCIESEVVAFTNYAAIIAPAKHSDINLSGITATPKEFSGDEQAIASGELIASIPTTNKVIDKEIIDIKYCFVGKDEFEPSKTSTWYGSLADAKETQVGKYKLFVWLTTTTNIDQSTDYIVPVLGDSLTEITPIDGHKLNIVGLGIAKEDDLVYTGEEVRLITSAPRLQMRNGTDLEGNLGAVKYYISGDWDEFTTEGTTKEDRAYNLSEVTELNAGTYYIWVAFEEGDNHTSIDRRYVAKVTITAASGDNIELSGININQALTYNGQNQDLITTEVVQNINGNTLNAENVESVEYGYSNNPKIQPTSYVSEIADLEARDADKYYIWIKAITKSNSVTNQKNITDYVKLYSEEEFAQIFKATLSLSNIGISENEGLVYIGQAQSLATFIDGKTIITLDNNGINLNTDELNPDLVCEWGLGKDTITAPTTWVEDINELEGTNAGDYYLWVRVEKESKNFSAFNAKHFKTINIGQADICLEKDLIVKTGLKYTGTAQSLVESAPIIKFRAVNGEYIEATGLVVKYAIVAEEILTGDIEEIKATDAKEYEIYYYVEADTENNNWKLTEFTAEVEIAKVAADIEGIGLSATPEAKEKLIYNGTSQDLITYGALAIIEGGRGAGLEGSQIVFFYNDAPNIKYSYSFNQSENKHVWLNDAALPGKQNVGTYEITYYVTASTTGNFVESEAKTLTVEITSCDVQWEQRPTAKTGLKYPGYNIPLIEAGVLTATENEELYVEYTLDAPEVGQRTWQKDMPEADKAGNYTIWYRVHTSENYNFVGTEDNITGEKLEIVVESYTLSVVSLPQSKQMMYTGESQEIIFEGAELSTDEGNLTENAPFFEYSLDGKVYRPVLELKNTGTYDVYYRINYNDTIFTFVPNEVCESDGRLTLLRTTITINKLTFEENTLKAVYEDGEMTYINGSYPFMNEEIAEHIQYFYRKSGSEGWTPWEAGALENAELGTYEFKLKLTAPNDDANFYDFEQTCEYSTHIVKRNRVVEIVMGDYNAQHGLPTVRAWVDLDGATTYETAAFRVEGTVAKNGKLTLGITDVSEANDNALIRVEVVSAGYFYMSSETLAEATKLSILLSSEIVNQTAINQGLTEETTYLYVYELYKITYDANGGEGTIEEDWKWHGIDLTLKENTYTKTTENEIELITNGWNDSITGSGKHYGNGSMTYTDNETVVLYAQYFAIDETIYRVEWIIDNGTNRYAVARDGNWYNTSEDSSRGGQLIKEGDLIILPQVNVDKDGNDLAEIFGGYILGWYTEDENMPYEFGMTATRDIVFVALLNEDASDYIECKFYNKDNEEVHSSGKVANGASAYMALSGLDYNTLQTYLENFEAWNELNNAETLDSSKVESGVFNYSLEEKAEEPEPKPEPEPEPEPEIEKSTNTNGIMFVIIGVGVAVSAAMIVIYMIIRKRRR